MIKVTIHYPNTAGSRFDMDYYLRVHMPLSIRLLDQALLGHSVETGVNGGTPESPPPFVALCHLLFASAEAFYEAFLPHAEGLQADIPNYTDVEPIIQISEVRLAG